ncbi:hypothetical protein M4D52_25595 [Paenibacillus lactis]|uniref:hypothetical protein n=1 Tax=Paenibacillus lactis TaxID=228574 RepID=UPI00203F1331|nr:hypothetical protein [Paenibacillus lactis]MCM3496825.1 hypothetical protein [Paenibacillus lactis]
MNTTGWIILILFIIADVFIISYLVRRSSRKERAISPVRRRNPFRNAPEPPQVAEPGSPAYALSKRLEASLPSALPDAVKQRVMTEYPELTEREYEWRWVELKRFFIMCAVMDRVPMFSKAVDEVWHEMLMYTYEYQQFSDRFLGRMLHHAPNTGSEQVSMKNERAWFDVIYVQLFGWNEYSAVLWGPFFRVPLSREELEEFRHTHSFIENERFNSWTYERLPEAAEAIDQVVGGLKERLSEAENGSPPASRKVDYGNNEVLLASAVFFAWHYSDDFMHRMEPEEKYTEKTAGATGSSCTYASACGSGGHDDSGDGGGSGSDASCSSGSSCSGGSSCSSCGGGGCSS